MADAHAVETKAVPTSDAHQPPPEHQATLERSGANHNDGEGDEDISYKDDEQPPLPFSKARCIALVATLTGASFLNVCAPLGRKASRRLTGDHRRYRYRVW